MNLFADDFEAGALVKPTGRWDAARTVAGQTIVASTAAAHRGVWGLQVVDTVSTTGAGMGAAVEHSFSGSSANHYLRVWERVTSTNGQGSIFSLQAVNDRTNLSSVDFVQNFGANTVSTGGDQVGGYGYDPGQGGVSAGVWHLIEVAVVGAGTATGVRKLAVDGVVSVSSPQDLSADSVNLHELGEPFEDDKRYTGTLDFDDFRSDTVPQASTLRLAAASAATGACTAVTASLVDSFGLAAAGAPYAFNPALTVTGVTGSFFSDAACTAAATTVAFAPGDSSATTYFRANTAGTASLTIADQDFLSGSASLAISAVPTRLVFSTPSRTFTGGVCGGTAAPVTIQLQDGAGNAFSAGPGGQALTLATSSAGGSFYSDSGCLVPASGNGFTIPSGRDTVDVYYLDTRAGSPALSVSNASGLANPAPQMETVLAAAPVALRVFGIPSPTSRGAPVTVVVQAQDAFANPATGYTGRIHFSSTDKSALLPADYAFAAADQGTHAFGSGLTLETVGLQSVVVADSLTPSITGVQTNINVVESSPLSYRIGCGCRSAPEATQLWLVGGVVALMRRSRRRTMGRLRGIPRGARAHVPPRRIGPLFFSKRR